MGLYVNTLIDEVYKLTQELRKMAYCAIFTSACELKDLFIELELRLVLAESRIGFVNRSKLDWVLVCANKKGINIINSQFEH